MRLLDSTNPHRKSGSVLGYFQSSLRDCLSESPWIRVFVLIDDLGTCFRSFWFLTNLLNTLHIPNDLVSA
jgi:hypothetical protein